MQAYGELFLSFFSFFCNAPYQYFDRYWTEVVLYEYVLYCPNVTRLLYDLLIFLFVALTILAF